MHMTELFTTFPYAAALAAGLLSFLSPCVLPLIPSYLSFLTGISYEELEAGRDRFRIRFLTMSHSLMFVVGFSLVFVAMGASASAIGQVFQQYQSWLRIGGGILVIVFGLFVAGFFRMDAFLAEKRFHFAGKPAGYLGSTAVGMAFAAGWTPCIGPILGTILTYADTQDSMLYGARLLLSYSLGLAVPFLFAALAFNAFLCYSKKIRKHMRIVMVASGLLLVLFGILLLTDKLSVITGLFPTSPFLI